MKKIAAGIFCAVMLLSNATSVAQSNRERRLLLNDYVAPDEIVSLSATLPFDKALLVISDVSKKYASKILVNETALTAPTGVDINNMHWLQALETILHANNCWYEEKEEYFRIFALNGATVTMGADNKVVALRVDTTGRMVMHARDVKISTWFFSLDVQKSLNYGINWNFFYSGDSSVSKPAVKFGGNLIGGLPDPTASGSTTTSQDNNFVGKIIPSINFGNISALVSLFQGNNLGEVLSSPSIVVSSGKKGGILIGQKFFTNTKDISGNTIQKEQSAGISIDVVPTVYEENGLKFVNLDIAVSRSTRSGTTDPVINTSEVKTFSVLYDGEELVLGGLYNNTETTERGGIPILKDLPWWVFGLKYVFGYDKALTSKQELIILLKVDVVPSIEERVAAKSKEFENLIQHQMESDSKDIERRKSKKE
jgi:Bacterial type II and III secretion system protein